MSGVYGERLKEEMRRKGRRGGRAREGVGGGREGERERERGRERERERENRSFVISFVKRERDPSARSLKILKNIRKMKTVVLVRSEATVTISPRLWVYTSLISKVLQSLSLSIGVKGWHHPHLVARVAARFVACRIEIRRPISMRYSTSLSSGTEELILYLTAKLSLVNKIQTQRSGCGKVMVRLCKSLLCSRMLAWHHRRWAQR